MVGLDGVIRLFGSRSVREETRRTSAFSRALLAELPRLRRYAIALVGDVSKADDLVQDSAERAIKNQAMLESLEKLYPWLRSILHNLHIDGIRQRSRWGPMDDVDAFTDSLALSVPAADGAIAVDLGRAMAELSVEHRAILLLSGLEGLSYREIGETLGIPIGTVMSRLARAREQLRRRLEGERV